MLPDFCFFEYNFFFYEFPVFCVNLFSSPHTHGLYIYDIMFVSWPSGAEHVATLIGIVLLFYFFCSNFLG